MLGTYRGPRLRPVSTIVMVAVGTAMGVAGVGVTEASAARVLLHFAHADPSTTDGFRAYLGARSGRYARSVDLGTPWRSGDLLTAQVQTEPEERYVVVTAYNAAGESARSNEGVLPQTLEGAAGPAARVFIAFDYLGFPLLGGFGLDGAAAGLAALQRVSFAEGGAVPEPVWCQLDDEPGRELVLGSGDGAPETLEVRAVADDVYVPVASLDLSGGHLSGQPGVRPACGDLDGDGRDEIVVGYGAGGGGIALALDDALAGHRGLAVVVAEPSLGDGSTAPAVGDLDGDGRGEIVVGFGPGSGGRLRVVDDARRSFSPGVTGAPEGWLQLGWPAYEDADGRVRPAAGDLDGDGRDELVLGLGAITGGLLRALDDGRAAFAPLPTEQGSGWLAVTGAGPSAGDTVPVVEDVDGDGRAEVLVELGPAAGGAFALFDDARSVRPLGFAGLDRIPASDLGATRIAR